MANQAHALDGRKHGVSHGIKPHTIGIDTCMDRLFLSDMQQALPNWRLLAPNTQ